ncbi:MAG: hypothetical protein H3C63_04195, partial [Candidatus Omnitrophica bacterium]|nr:hypothetical protein [Candidatus Omnitrophota bacterium]
GDIEDPILTRKFRVENPQCIGKNLSELSLHGMTQANISRIHRGDRVLAAKWEMDFQQNDVVLAVGTEAGLNKLQIILGPEVHEDFPLSPDVIAREVYVSEHRVAGKSLVELAIPEHFGVVVTRVAREDIELVPTGAMRLEIGDLLRIVGSPEDCEAFIAYCGKHEKKIHETPILPFGGAAGLCSDPHTRRHPDPTGAGGRPIVRRPGAQLPRACGFADHAHPLCGAFYPA